MSGLFLTLLLFETLGTALLVDQDDCAENGDFSADAEERPECSVLV